MKTQLGPATLAFLLAACGSGNAGNSAAHEPPGQAIVLPAATITARSQLWAPLYAGLKTDSLRLHLLPDAAACADPEGLVQRPDVPWITATVASPAAGVDCPVLPPMSEFEPPAGCAAQLTASRLDDRGHRFDSPASAGTLRIERAEGGRLVGTVRASFPSAFYTVSVCEENWAEDWDGNVIFLDGSCSCEEPEATRTCSMVGPEDTMCCDDGLEFVEVEIPFEADACEAAAECWGSPCPALVAGACAGAAPPPACDAACAGYEAVCRSCSGCPEGDTSCLSAAGCDAAVCRAACEGVLGQDPTYAEALGCFARSDTCDGWKSCMEFCDAG
jgi:hypothetical protein